jgi:hypothetical protein
VEITGTGPLPTRLLPHGSGFADRLPGRWRFRRGGWLGRWRELGAQCLEVFGLRIGMIHERLDIRRLAWGDADSFVDQPCDKRFHFMMHNFFLVKICPGLLWLPLCRRLAGAALFFIQVPATTVLLVRSFTILDAALSTPAASW